MERYTLQQRNEIIKIHYKNGENLAVTVRKTKAFFGSCKAPCRTAIQKLVKKFELFGQVGDVKNTTRARRSRTTENIAAVAQSVEENPGLSIPRRSLELGIPQTSLHRILHKDLGLKMPKEEIFDEPESSSDEEEPIVDEDICNKFEIENAFPVKYKISDESAVSLKKVYILSLCGDRSFKRIAAGLSNNSVQIFDINSNRGLSRPTIDSLTLASDGAICGVRFLDETANNLLVGSTNGDVALYDLRTGRKEHTFEDPAECNKKPITSFDLNANGRVICIGTDQVMHNVYLMFFDVRQKTVMGGYWESHQDDVTDVKFHPTNPDLMCTGSTDGLINVFDISATSEDDALTSTINTESSVHKLNWHKDVYEKDIISCITHTCDFKSYECEESDLVAEFERTHITEAIKRKSAADCNLVSCHNLADGGMFLLAASNYNKGEVVRSVQMQNKKLVPHGDFDGNKQIIRESIYDPQSSLLVTAGESGIVTLWSPSTADQSASKSGPNKLKAKSKKSHVKAPY